MNTYGLVDYYAKLLILQYQGKLKADATMRTVAAPFVMVQESRQSVTFGTAPFGGTWAVSWNGNHSAAINWDDSPGTIQTKIAAIPGLSQILLYALGPDVDYAFKFKGVVAPAPLLTVYSNTLVGNASQPVTIDIEEFDQTMPLAIENGFNLTGNGVADSATASAGGVQLDTLGKYAGVTRYGRGFSKPITLSDADYLSLIKMTIVKNSSGSSLATIQQLLYDYFGGNVLIFDYQNMRISYLVSSLVGHQDLIELFITEGVLPKPMGVLISVVIYGPSANFFGFRTYESANLVATPFNDYSDYHTDWPWLDYNEAFLP